MRQANQTITLIPVRIAERVIRPTPGEELTTDTAEATQKCRTRTLEGEKMKIRMFFRPCFFVTILTGLLLTQATAFSSSGRIISDISFSKNPNEATLKVSFNYPVRYLRHYPLNNGKEVRIQFEPIVTDTGDKLNLKKRESYFPPTANPAGAVRVEYEGRDLLKPTVLVVFDEPRNFDVKQGDDFRSIRVLVPFGIDAGDRNQPAASFSGSPGMSAKQPEQTLLAEGMRVMAEENYSRAIQVYTKLLDSQDPEVLETAQFQLALAREHIGHLAHARAEYENYLIKFPNGNHADEAKNRLSNLLGDFRAPMRNRSASRRMDTSYLENDFFGSISVYYDRDESYYEDNDGNLENEPVTNINSLFTNLDVTWRLRSDKYTIETTVIGSLENDLVEDRDDETRISALYTDFENKTESVNVRLGRQSSSKGGVFGHFDGARFGYRVHDKVRVNLVGGYPVERSSDGFDETGKYFYGLNFDLGSHDDGWGFNTYFIDQLNGNINDRRAVGTEIRYLGNRGSFFTLADYDILYNEIGIVLFTGDYVLPNDQTRITLSVDLRSSPLLCTSNALIGQTAPTLEMLVDEIGETAAHQLAEDRSLAGRFVTLGLSHPLTDKIQIAGDVSWSKVDGAPASGGVDAFESTGDEYYYSLQFYGNSLLKSDDLSTLSLRYAITELRDTSSIFASMRYPIGSRWRVSPKFQIDYRKNKLYTGDQMQYRPGLRLEYIPSRIWRFEIEGEYSYTDKKLPGLAIERKGYSFSLGSRFDF